MHAPDLTGTHSCLALAVIAVVAAVLIAIGSLAGPGGLFHMVGAASSPSFSGSQQHVDPVPLRKPAFVIGEPLYGFSMYREGKVYAFDRNTDLAWAHVGEVGPGGSSSNFGAAVAGADFDKDGFADVLVGAQTYKDDPYLQDGKAYVFSGKDGALMWSSLGQNPGDLFGYDVATGDINNDGHEDIIVSANEHDSGGFYQRGKVYVFSGNDYTLLGSKEGLDAKDYFGSALASGDVNNDGHDDLIVGSLNIVFSSPNERVDVFSGKDASLLWSKEVGGGFGRAVASADVNNDGFDDVVIGAWGMDKAFVYSGKDWSLLWTFTGENSGDRFGYAVGTTDVNADGHPDVIVGAEYFDDPLEEDVGKVYVYSGADGSLLWSQQGEAGTYWGWLEGEWFGHSVAGKDVNGDDFGDVIVGAPIHDSDATGYEQSGKAYVFSGKDWSLLWSAEGGYHTTSFGWDVSGL